MAHLAASFQQKRSPAPQPRDHEPHGKALEQSVQCGYKVLEPFGTEKE